MWLVHYYLTNIVNCFVDSFVGDLFLSDAVKSWNDSSGVLVEQRGFENAQAVLDWTSNQQMRGHLGSAPSGVIEDFVLMGNSAGAVGAPVWADRLFDAVAARKRAVVADSFVLFMPSDIEGQLFRDSADFCSSQLLPSSLSSNCAAGVCCPFPCNVHLKFIITLKVDNMSYICVGGRNSDCLGPGEVQYDSATLSTLCLHSAEAGQCSTILLQCNDDNLRPSNN